MDFARLLVMVAKLIFGFLIGHINSLSLILLMQTCLHLNTNELVSDCHFHWNQEKLNQVLPPYNVYKISSIPISITNLADEFVWGPASNGKFSIQSASSLISQKVPAHWI